MKQASSLSEASAALPAGALWWALSNLLFLHNPAVRLGDRAASVKAAQRRCPRLASLVLALAKEDRLGPPARGGESLPVALEPHHAMLLQCADEAAA